MKKMEMWLIVLFAVLGGVGVGALFMWIGSQIGAAEYWKVTIAALIASALIFIGVLGTSNKRKEPLTKSGKKEQLPPPTPKGKE